MKNEKMGLGPTLIPLSFESDLDHHLDTKNVKDIFFSHFLIMEALKNNTDFRSQSGLLYSLSLF